MPLIDFVYNNSYHSHIKMAPFNALYGRRCRCPIGWLMLVRPGYLAMKKVKVTKKRLKISQSHQKYYTDVRQRQLEFKVNDWVFLKISSMKGVMRFWKNEKLSPFAGMYLILRKIVNVSYELDFFMSLGFIHLVFHAFIRKMSMGDPSLVVPVEDISVTDSLFYEKVSIEIFDREVHRLTTKM